ncbi:hypothetical protein [Lysobacter gummosus]|uniref:hypothetical protein n=1 Tax=Lysobacter gummosus TaxID=262324 RepID=UPI00362C5B36
MAACVYPAGAGRVSEGHSRTPRARDHHAGPRSKCRRGFLNARCDNPPTTDPSIFLRRAIGDG